MTTKITVALYIHIYVLHIFLSYKKEGENFSGMESSVNVYGKLESPTICKQRNMTFRSSLNVRRKNLGEKSSALAFFSQAFVAPFACCMTTDLLNDATFGVKDYKEVCVSAAATLATFIYTHLVFIFSICPLSQVGIDSDRELCN